MKRYSKAQMGMMEMIIVLLVVFVILILAIFFYYQFFLSSIQGTVVELGELERDILLTAILSSPEIQCSLNTVQKPCIDTLKLNTNTVDKNKLFYNQVFGFKTIKVKQLYPDSSEGNCKDKFRNDYFNYPSNCDEWIIFNNPKPNYEKKEIVSTPVSLFFPLLDKYHVGELIIEVYQ